LARSLSGWGGVINGGNGSQRKRNFRGKEADDSAKNNLGRRGGKKGFKKKRKAISCLFRKKNVKKRGVVFRINGTKKRERCTRLLLAEDKGVSKCLQRESGRGQKGLLNAGTHGGRVFQTTKEASHHLFGRKEKSKNIKGKFSTYSPGGGGRGKKKRC